MNNLSKKLKNCDELKVHKNKKYTLRERSRIKNIREKEKENVRRMFEECSRNGKRKCSKNVPRMFEECSKNVPRMFQEFSKKILQKLWTKVMDEKLWTKSYGQMKCKDCSLGGNESL